MPTRRTRPTKKLRSGYEDRVAFYLDQRDVGYKYEEYSYEYTEPLRRNRSECDDCGSTNLVRTGWYTPDFFLDNGVIIEAKGRWSAADRRKMLAMKEQYPDEPIYMLFMRDNKLSKTANQTYTAWCESNGITCAVGMPPEEWLHGQARDTKQVESIAEKESANTTAAKRSGSGT